MEQENVTELPLATVVGWTWCDKHTSTGDTFRHHKRVHPGPVNEAPRPGRLYWVWWLVGVKRVAGRFGVQNPSASLPCPYTPGHLCTRPKDTTACNVSLRNACDWVCVCASTRWLPFAVEVRAQQVRQSTYNADDAQDIHGGEQGVGIQLQCTAAMYKQQAQGHKDPRVDNRW